MSVRSGSLAWLVVAWMISQEDKLLRFYHIYDSSERSGGGCYNGDVMTVRTRYAPSPTGDPHLGNVRTALFDWLLARHYGGQFILRIEDTDPARYTEGGVEAQMEALRWLGLDWDEGPDVGGAASPLLQARRAA